MKKDLIYGIDDKPPLSTTLGLGFQHYLTMFGSTVAIPLIMADALGMTEAKDKGILIGTMFFVSGITTLLQTSWGNRLPLVQGGTFSLLTPAIAICGMAALANVGWEVRMQHVQGAVILGSVFEIIAGYSGLVGKMLKYVGPITIAPTIALIGLALFKFGAPVAGTHWGIGALTIGLIILFSQYLRRKHRVFELFPIMLGILIAWATAWVLTATGVFAEGHPAFVSFANVTDARWIQVPYPIPMGMAGVRRGRGRGDARGVYRVDRGVRGRLLRLLAPCRRPGAERQGCEPRDRDGGYREPDRRDHRDGERHHLIQREHRRDRADPGGQPSGGPGGGGDHDRPGHVREVRRSVHHHPPADRGRDVPA